MAEVSADDVSLDFSSAVPVVLYHGHTIDDAAGNDNGYLDPGETVDLITICKNFGTAATDVNGTLLCSDPYITIHDGTSSFGDIASGDTASNASDPFSVEASPGAPTGHLVDLSFVAEAQGGTSDTSHISLCIGKFHYFVWDPSPDMSSGPAIDTALKDAGYNGMFSQSLPVTTLDRYSAVFVSVGIFSDNFIIENGTPEAIALVNFVNSGGRMYLEGGDVWYYDPLYQNGYNFGAHFGVNAISDGSADLSTVQGQSSTFTTGMNFAYSGENSYIDHLSATGSGFVIFKNSSPVYDCGIANDAGTYKTVGTSFEFGGLVDGTPPSTKAALADSIMQFFGLGLGVEQEPVAQQRPKQYCLSQNQPNPFAYQTTFSYAIPQEGSVTIQLYDASGRMVRTIVKGMRTAGYHAATLDAKDLQAGIYFIKMIAGNTHLSKKCIVVK